MEGELQDFSISRIKEKMPWGVEVPDDPKHVMYVWFDALTNYISTIGWPEDTAEFEKYWGTKDEPLAVQVAGKDNLRQQSSMWQAMLFAADLPLTRQIVIHGFITSGGQKMSKSLGNVIDPLEFSEKYGVDALRYYLLAKVSPFEDSDFTKEKFEEVYKSDLQNGLGNLVARVATLCAKAGVGNVKPDEVIDNTLQTHLEAYHFDSALEEIWAKIRLTDQALSTDKPWKIEDLNELAKSMLPTAKNIVDIAYSLKPFMPDTPENTATFW